MSGRGRANEPGECSVSGLARAWRDRSRRGLEHRGPKCPSRGGRQRHRRAAVGRQPSLRPCHPRRSAGRDAPGGDRHDSAGAGRLAVKGNCPGQATARDQYTEHHDATENGHSTHYISPRSREYLHVSFMARAPLNWPNELLQKPAARLMRSAIRVCTSRKSGMRRDSGNNAEPSDPGKMPAPSRVSPSATRRRVLRAAGRASGDGN